MVWKAFEASEEVGRDDSAVHYEQLRIKVDQHVLTSIALNEISKPLVSSVRYT